jgi:alpha-tubulin suppressor-like RCC1 family protein
MNKFGLGIGPLIGLLLVACGGGGSGASAPPVPPVSEPAPVVAGVAPLQATVGIASTFSVSGSNLPAGLTLTIAGCEGSVEMAGGNSTLRQFSCTPRGSYGNHQATVSLPGATSGLFSGQVDFQAAVTSADTSGGRNAVIAADGSLFVWGTGGMQGDGTGKAVTSPTRIGDGYSSVVTGLQSSLAIKQDGSLWTWGWNTDHLLGIDAPAGNATPVQIGTGFKKIAVKGAYTTGGESIVALKTDGTVWVWGSRSSPHPQTIEPGIVPWQIASGFSDIATGPTGDMLGLKPDGSLWSWGRNPSDTPFVPVKVAEGYVAVTSSYSESFGLKSDGTLWNWGTFPPNPPASGKADVAHPALVGGGFRSISTGIGYTMAIKEDGTLWAGGSNDQGQFGDGSTRGGPFRQVGTGYIAVWAGYDCTIAEKPDATFWAWGLCDFGDGNYMQRIYVPRKLAIP